MSASIEYLTDKENNILLPKTVTKAVYDDAGNRLDNTLNNLANLVNNKASANLVSDAYNPSKTYAQGEFCIYNNILWRSKVSNNAGNTPAENSYWTATNITNELNNAGSTNEITGTISTGNNKSTVFYNEHLNGLYAINVSMFHQYSSVDNVNGLLNTLIRINGVNVSAQGVRNMTGSNFNQSINYTGVINGNVEIEFYQGVSVNNINSNYTISITKIS